MGAIDDAQYQQVLAASAVAPKYATPIDRESAHELLQKRLAAAAPDPPPTRARASKQPAEKSAFEDVMGSRVMKNAANQAVRSLVREGMRDSSEC